MTDTIMLEAPARGGRISDLADGQGRILRLHDLTASSLGHTSHANQTESPTRTGGRVTMGNTSTQPCRMAPGGHRRRTHHH